jgi:hypothetical protein
LAYSYLCVCMKEKWKNKKSDALKKIKTFDFWKASSSLSALLFLFQKFFSFLILDFLCTCFRNEFKRKKWNFKTNWKSPPTTCSCYIYMHSVLLLVIASHIHLLYLKRKKEHFFSPLEFKTLFKKKNSSVCSACMHWFTIFILFHK